MANLIRVCVLNSCDNRFFIVYFRVLRPRSFCPLQGEPPGAASSQASCSRARKFFKNFRYARSAPLQRLVIRPRLRLLQRPQHLVAVLPPRLRQAYQLLLAVRLVPQDYQAVADTFLYERVYRRLRNEPLLAYLLLRIVAAVAQRVQEQRQVLLYPHLPAPAVIYLVYAVQTQHYSAYLDLLILHLSRPPSCSVRIRILV